VEHDKPPDAEGDPSMNEVEVVVVIVVVIVVMEAESWVDDSSTHDSAVDCCSCDCGGDCGGSYALEPFESATTVATTLSAIPELSSFLESSTLTPFSTPLKIFLALIHPF